LPSDDLYNSYVSPDIARVMPLRKMSRTGHVECVEEKRNTQNFDGKSRKKQPI
jgi:hypothetical protein